MLAGPGTGLLDPDAIFGDLLLPLVSISVAIILFEGGLSLDISELRGIGKVIRNLITIGIVITWTGVAVSAYVIFGLDPSLAILLGAILVVTGPTVIIPLLRQVRPTGRIGNVVKWEGILNDPIGAVLAVLVFEGILLGGLGSATARTGLGIVRAAAAGGIVGLAGAFVIVQLLRRHWVPDFLQNPVALSVVIVVHALANQVQTESGLLAVTVMGVALASQKSTPVRHIIEFKENLRVLLISALFIILAARVPLDRLGEIAGGAAVFVLALIVVVRPVCVAAATLGSDLNWRERLLLGWMAPRGVVAAAVGSIFAIRLQEAGFARAGDLVQLTFAVILGTVAIYGLSAGPLARWLGLASPNPQGVLLVGAHSWARTIARALRDAGASVVLVDSNRWNVAAAASDGLEAVHLNVLDERLTEEADLEEVGHMLALTPNDEVNALSALHFRDALGRGHVYQLPPEADEGAMGTAAAIPAHLTGRLLFDRRATYRWLSHRFALGAEVEAVRLDDDLDQATFERRFGRGALPLFVLRDSGSLVVAGADRRPALRGGHTVIVLRDVRGGSVTPADEVAANGAEVTRAEEGENRDAG